MDLRDTPLLLRDPYIRCIIRMYTGQSKHGRNKKACGQREMDRRLIGVSRVCILLPAIARVNTAGKKLSERCYTAICAVVTEKGKLQRNKMKMCFSVAKPP